MHRTVGLWTYLCEAALSIVACGSSRHLVLPSYAPYSMPSCGYKFGTFHSDTHWQLQIAKKPDILQYGSARRLDVVGPLAPMIFAPEDVKFRDAVLEDCDWRESSTTPKS